jgi:hypothetical protein
LSWSAGVYQGSIQLVGLVGTYQEGLAYLEQQQQQHAAVGGGKDIITPCDSCDSTCTGSNKPLSLQLPAVHNLLLSATSDEDSSAAAEATNSSSSSSSIDLQGAAARPGLSHHGSGSSSISSDWFVELSATAAASSGAAAAAPAGEELYAISAAAPPLCPTAAQPGQPIRHQQLPAVASTASTAAPAGKVILWLGSSIGNSTREEGAAFLRQLKEAAMQPGRVNGKR